MSAGIGMAVWFGRRLITTVLPVVGVAALGLVGWWLAGAAATGHPVGLVVVAMLLRAEPGTAAVERTLLLSIGLSLLNSIPLFPAVRGGSRSVAAHRGASMTVGSPRPPSTWASTAEAVHWFRVGTGVVAAGLVLYLIVADLWWLIT